MSVQFRRLRVVTLLGAVALQATVAAAAELRVLSAAAVKGPATEIAAAYERDTGDRVVFEFTTAGQVASRLAAGARPDVVLNTRSRIDERVASTSPGALVRDVGTVRIGVAVRPGAHRPDLSDEASVRAALLAAASITYTDPAAGGTAGAHFARVLARLGIADAMRGRTVLAADGIDVMGKVVRGEVELGFTQVSEILPADRTAYAGPLPDTLQLRTTYAALVPDATMPGARALVDALTGDAGRARFSAAGFE